jgi:hypothetical protein
VARMQGDKKNRGGDIYFSLPAGLGWMHADRWTTSAPEAVIRAALATPVRT